MTALQSEAVRSCLMLAPGSVLLLALRLGGVAKQLGHQLADARHQGVHRKGLGQHLHACKGFGNNVRRRAGAGIGDPQPQIFPFREVQDAGSFRVQKLIARLDDDSSPVGHGVAGVDADIQQGILELPRVYQGCPDRMFFERLHSDTRTDSMLDKLNHAGNKIICIGGPGVQRLAP